MFRKTDIIKEEKNNTKLYSIGVFIAAYNEESHIEEKLNNLLCQIYPYRKIGIHIINDCSEDKTGWIIKKNIKKFDKKFIDFTIENSTENKGKVNCLNRLIKKYKQNYDVIVFTDVSALISIDCFKQVNKYMSDPKIVAISGKYNPKPNEHDNLNKYWDYQNKIRELEGKIGSVNGFAGAMYAMKSSFVKELNPTIINDDFVQVLNSLSKDRYAYFSNNISIVENEEDTMNQDLKRRMRISAGNWQQLSIIFSMLKKLNKKQAFSFLSNKFLRGLMPIIISLSYIILILKSFNGDQIAQVLIFMAAICHSIGLIKKVFKINKKIILIDQVNYIIFSYFSGIVGIILLSKYKKKWSKLKETNINNDYIKILIYKRIMDIVGAIVGIIISIPIITIAAIMIKLDSKGSIFYKQLRVGIVTEKQSNLIYIYKLRTMYQDIEKKSGIKWATKNDERITKVGSFLRKSRIDELPQFWNVLIGEMSLIGPRPERPTFYNKLEEKIPYFKTRTFNLKPGISGLAQVENGYDNSVNDVKNKIAWDYSYMLSMSNFSSWIKIEFKILIKTIKIIILKKGQ
jgi:lipopolysaccharide/colanic/teichoic acid biosynthesis glycosyltransferase